MTVPAHAWLQANAVPVGLALPAPVIPYAAIAMGAWSTTNPVVSCLPLPLA
jgi:hypothetical protein